MGKQFVLVKFDFAYYWFEFGNQLNLANYGMKANKNYPHYNAANFYCGYGERILYLEQDFF
jgi:hypothetical protein